MAKVDDSVPAMAKVDGLEGPCASAAVSAECGSRCSSSLREQLNDKWESTDSTSGETLQ